jgi:hypothetical protein
MTRNIFAIPFILLPALVFRGEVQARNHCEELVSQIKTIKRMPDRLSGHYFTDGDSLFWEIVKCKLEIVPYLIRKLDDKTPSGATEKMEDTVYTYTVADIAYFAMDEIIYGMPIDYFLGKPWWEKPEYWPYWKVVNSPGARKIFRKRAHQWFDENKDRLVFRSCENWQACEIYGKHPNGGYYVLKE